MQNNFINCVNLNLRTTKLLHNFMQIFNNFSRVFYWPEWNELNTIHMHI